MAPRVSQTISDPAPPPVLPDWVTGRARDLPEAGFAAGAALASLHPVLRRADLPQDLWRARLALAAAVASLRHLGRRDTEGPLRDALEFCRPGDNPGPAGAVLALWRGAVRAPLTPAGLGALMPGLGAEGVAMVLDAGAAAPLPLRPATVLGAALQARPKDPVAALVLADAGLAAALGWGRMVPLLGLALSPRDLRGAAGDLALASARALPVAVGQALGQGGDLIRRAGALQAVASRLRAKAAGRALEIILSRDVIAPVALSGLMSDRAARRLCDRLVSLGVLREMTGRESFRLYGV